MIVQQELIGFQISAAIELDAYNAQLYHSFFYDPARLHDLPVRLGLLLIDAYTLHYTLIDQSVTVSTRSFINFLRAPSAWKSVVLCVPCPRLAAAAIMTLRSIFLHGSCFQLPNCSEANPNVPGDNSRMSWRLGFSAVFFKVEWQ